MPQTAQPSPSQGGHGETRTERRKKRQKEQILAEAWKMAADEGLAGISVRKLGSTVDMEGSSLYTYFDSKMAIYDAMFSQAYTNLLAHMRKQPRAHDPRAAVRDACLALAAYTEKNPTAGDLIFQRAIPGFKPTPDAIAVAVQFQAEMEELLSAAGVTDPGDTDICIAIVGGLIQQQDTNDPGGHRYIRHLDTVLAMFFAYLDGRTDSDPAVEPSEQDHQTE